MDFEKWVGRIVKYDSVDRHFKVGILYEDFAVAASCLSSSEKIVVATHHRGRRDL